MQNLKSLLLNNKLQSFFVAVAIWAADFVKSNATFSWQGFAIALVGFLGTYVTTHFSVKEAVATTTAEMIPFTYPAPTVSGSIIVAPEVVPNEPINQNTSTI